ncbi:hypothetical protein EV702DRAFT_1166852 [Suillus placidus]|uniref:Uncharacterized protein n=1 Tax=Suillus placidus TaxID=48579 RepID=A0A9P7CUP4_9AGAM|nr:hypothetical protein EV702DRAFT_1166852 [Suillus placidus]
MNFVSDIAILLMISDAVVLFFCIGSFCELRDERTVIMFFWLISIMSSCVSLVSLEQPF